MECIVFLLVVSLTASSVYLYSPLNGYAISYATEKEEDYSKAEPEFEAPSEFYVEFPDQPVNDYHPDEFGYEYNDTEYYYDVTENPDVYFPGGQVLQPPLNITDTSEQQPDNAKGEEEHSDQTEIPQKSNNKRETDENEPAKENPNNKTVVDPKDNCPPNYILDKNGVCQKEE